MPKVRKSLDHTRKPKIKILLKSLSPLQKTLLEANITFLTAVSWNCLPKSKKLYTQNPKLYEKRYLLIQVSTGQKECNFENVIKKYNQ